MLRTLRGRMTYANTMATLALFVALGGSSYAAFTLPKNSVGIKQLKNNAVTSSKIKNGAVTAKKLNVKGVTVPNAVHADTATHANSADTAATAGGAPPTGPAGGDLSGTYPNPSIAPGVLTAGMFGSLPAVRAYNNIDQTINNATTLAFDSNDYDTAGMHNTSTNNSRLTAPITGIYQISATVEWNAGNSPTPTAGGRLSLLLVLNGSQVLADLEEPVVNGAYQQGTQVLATDYKLIAGQYVQLSASQNTGGPFDVESDLDASPAFSMRWVTPG